MDVLKSKAMLETLKWLLIKYGKIEDVQAQEINKVFSFILDYRYVVLSGGMQLSELTKSKCSLVDLSEI
jgi:predicted PolB exonuclease-like 3'-5' exonuclease